MGQKKSLPAKKDEVLINETSLQRKAVVPFPSIDFDSRKLDTKNKKCSRHSGEGFRRKFKTLLKTFVGRIIPSHKKSKRYVVAKTNTSTAASITYPYEIFDNCNDNSRTAVDVLGSGLAQTRFPIREEKQLHWLRSKHSSLLSYALSKLAFFTRQSEERLEKNKEPVQRINLSRLADNKDLRSKLIQKILAKHSSMQLVSSAKPAVSQVLCVKKCQSPEEIYRRNLKKFEKLMVLTASTSSSSTSQRSGGFSMPTAMSHVKSVGTDGVNNNVIIGLGGSGELDVNCNPTPKRIISMSKNQPAMDPNFMEWVKEKMVPLGSPNPDTQEIIVGKVEVSTSSSDRLPGSSDPTSSSSPKTITTRDINTSTTTATDTAANTKTPATSVTATSRPSKFKFLKKGSHRGTGAGVNSSTKSRGKTSKKTGTSSTSTPRTIGSRRRCEKCGPCAGKDGLAGAPPVYLDYGEGGAANASGGAWKTRAKGDPIMDRLKNVDVVEQMTYMVPKEGKGDCCEEMHEDEDDDCEYYAVCESCGEMEPVPEALQKELKNKKRKRKESDGTTPVTYSRRQRFNFKSKGEMGDEEGDGPPYPYEGLQCPGQGCRCPCCVAGLRRDPNCECKCCQIMGSARKCNSFDEIPVGKNPQIRRILCPDEECARIRETCHKMMPDTSGLYNYDIDAQKFERQVPRTPTPIVVEIEAPKPLSKQQLLALAREIQEKKRRGIGVDACCPPQEQQAMYLPPIYGQCNPPCVPNYCCQPCQPCCQDAAKTNNERNTASNYTYGSYTATATNSRTPYTPTPVTTPSKTSSHTKASTTDKTYSNKPEERPKKDNQSTVNKGSVTLKKAPVFKKASSSESLPTF